MPSDAAKPSPPKLNESSKTTSTNSCQAGALSAEFADDMFRRRVELDRALDLHAQNPSAHLRADLESQAAELGRITNFVLRYKPAVEGGIEPSDSLGAFLLARELDDEATSLRHQIDIGNARLANPSAAGSELTYSHGLARLNERAVERARPDRNGTGQRPRRRTMERNRGAAWTRELDQLQRRIDGYGPPVNGSLDDAVDTHAAYIAGDMRDLDDAEAIFNENRFVDHRMQWPVRRRDELAAAIPPVKPKCSPPSRPEAVEGSRRPRPGERVGNGPVHPVRLRGPTGVAVMSLAQAEQNLVANDRVIRMLEGDLVNKQVQSSALDGTLQHRFTLLERELGDVDTPPIPADLALENDAIRGPPPRQNNAPSTRRVGNDRIQPGPHRTVEPWPTPRTHSPVARRRDRPATQSRRRLRPGDGRRRRPRRRRP